MEMSFGLSRTFTSDLNFKAIVRNLISTKKARFLLETGFIYYKPLLTKISHMLT